MTATDDQRRSNMLRTRIFKGWSMSGQRRYERAAFFCPIKLTLLPDGPAVKASSFDISLAGVGLMAPLFIERGKNVRLDFHLKKENEYVEETVLGRVAYSRADENGNRLGVEFLEPLKETSQPELVKKLNSL